MAIVTGGLGGLGLLATYELCAAGKERVVTVSRSGRTAGGRIQDELLETLQERTVHQTVRCDLADAGAMTDAFFIANKGWAQKPVGEARSCPPPRTSGDPLELLRGIASCLLRVRQEGLSGRLGVRQFNRALRVHDVVAACVADAERLHRRASKPPPPSVQYRLQAYRQRLADIRKVADAIWWDVEESLGPRTDAVLTTVGSATSE